MRVLLSDGSGLTSRQVATQAAMAGHVVEAVAPTWLGPASLTRHVRRVHRVPAFGRDPEGWLDATLDVLRTGGHDALLGTHDQVALLSRDAARVSELGVALGRPTVCEPAARAGQGGAGENAARGRTAATPDLGHDLTRGAPRTRGTPRLPQGADRDGEQRRPARERPRRTAARRKRLRARGRRRHAGFLPGPLVMVRAVFDHGELLAWHANLREREGSSGGASAKRSIALPVIGNHLESLGGALLAVSTGERVNPLRPGRPGVRTHQLLLAILGAAQHGRGRRGIARELAAALTHRGPYAGSTEELTPLDGDPLAAIPVTAAALATLTHPASWRLFTDSAVSAYALPRPHGNRS
jgi:hypothetical protein